MKLDDVDFNFSGDVSFDNIIIFNSTNDTLFYAPNLTINPKSVQNAIVDNNYDFDEARRLYFEDVKKRAEKNVERRSCHRLGRFGLLLPEADAAQGVQTRY